MNESSSRLTRAAAFTLSVGAICGAAAFLAPTAQASTGAATGPANVAARTLIDSTHPVIPADFAAIMGYRPVLDGTTMVNPGGSCSSPVTLPVGFDTACKAHDLGYDVLRYGERTGTPLGSWARKGLDAQLHTRMHDSCDARPDPAARNGCYAMADIAAGFVDANSWRQGYRSPEPEHLAPFLIAGVLGAAGAAAGVVALRKAQRSTSSAVQA